MGVTVILNVAENPSAALAITKILCPDFRFTTKKGAGGNKIHNFTLNRGGDLIKMKFTSVRGHLMKYHFEKLPPLPRGTRRREPADDLEFFDRAVEKVLTDIDGGRHNYASTLTEESLLSNELYLWTDLDVEGANINSEIISVCCRANPNLLIKRANFFDINRREIFRAFDNVVPLDDHNHFASLSVDVRNQIDLRFCTALTCFQNRELKRILPIDNQSKLSYGSCQFPTLGYVVEQYEKAKKFKPTETFSISVSHTLGENNFEFSWSKPPLTDSAAVSAVLIECLRKSQATVSTVKRTIGFKLSPPPPLNTLELQMKASKLFRLSSEAIMDIAEDLYLAGLISYPRTKSTKFSCDITRLIELVQMQAHVEEWSLYCDRLLNQGLFSPPGEIGVFEVHQPIHPVAPYVARPKWGRSHMTVYRFIVHCFLACLSRPALADLSLHEIDIAGEKFSREGFIIKERSFLRIYPYEVWNEYPLAPYDLHEQFTPSLLKSVTAKSVPSPLTESGLLEWMAQERIGKDSTRHKHIKNMIENGYAERVHEDSELVIKPTLLGEGLIVGYDAMGSDIAKPVIRHKIEEYADSITKYAAVGFILLKSTESMRNYYIHVLNNKDILTEAVSKALVRCKQVVRECAVCKTDMLLGKRSIDDQYVVKCLKQQCKPILLPPVTEVALTSQTCKSCKPGNVYLIKFLFRKHEIPYGFDLSRTGCIFCDKQLSTLIRLMDPECLSSARSKGLKASTTSNAQQGKRQTIRCDELGESSTNASGSRADCNFCGEEGHAVDNCLLKPRHKRSYAELNPNPQTGKSVQCSSCGKTCQIIICRGAPNNGKKFYKCPTATCDVLPFAEDITRSRGTRRKGSATLSSRRPICYKCGGDGHLSTECFRF